MRLYWLILFLLPSLLFSEFSKEVESKVLYFANKGEITQALTIYLKEAKKEGHNFKLLQECGIATITQGMKSDDEEARFLSVLGAGVAMHRLSMPILKQAIQGLDPKLQLVSLNFLDKYNEDEAIALIKEALSSPVLLVRLEAALLLAERDETLVIDHLQSLYGKVQPEVRSLFPQILVMLDNEASSNFLKQLLTEQDYKIRLATIYFAAKANRDDLLEPIRKMANHPGYPVEEAAAFALGKFKDMQSKDLLIALTKRQNSEVTLAASNALFQLGDKTYLEIITEEALKKNLFAIHLLSEILDNEAVIKTLRSLKQDPDFDVKLNVHFALLKLRQKEVMPFFKALFSENEKDIGFYTVDSAGKSLRYWKTVGSFSQYVNKIPELAEVSLKFKAEVLTRALELPEADFLDLAKTILEREQKSPLVPLTTQLLSNHSSEKTLALLKEKLNQVGAPMVRASCALALYELTHEKIYKDKLLQFIKQEKGKEIVVDVPKKETKLQETSPYLLTAKEASSLVINALETLSSSFDLDALETLIDVIAYGNPKNRYALSGLLIRMAE